MGVSFLPVRGILGSAYLVNPGFRVITDPFSGEEVVLVEALSPDVTLVHGSRADTRGNLLIPRRSDALLAIRASRRVIATVEERVEEELHDEPDWRLIPAFFVSALVHCPGGAAPTDFSGYYGPDEEHIALYLKRSKDPAAFADYLQEYVYREKLTAD